MRKVPDEHEIVRLRPKALEPDRWVVMRSERIDLFDVGREQLSPGLGRLPGSRLVRMHHSGRPHSEVCDRVVRHPDYILDTLLGERSVRILVLGLRPPVL